MKTDLDVQMIALFEGEHKQEWFGKINAKRQIPVLEVEDGCYISESAVIAKYLCRAAGDVPLYPSKYFYLYSSLIPA